MVTQQRMALIRAAAREEAKADEIRARQREELREIEERRYERRYGA